MEMIKWSPFRELEEIQRRLNRMFSDTPARMTEEPFFVADWAPPVDIDETDQAYSVKVDLPDVKKDDIKVEMRDGVLSIEGERRQEKEEKGKKFHRIERQYGQFVRRFSLPNVENAKAQAEFKEGVLTVTLPKMAAAVDKPVAVKVA